MTRSQSKSSKHFLTVTFYSLLLYLTDLKECLKHSQTDRNLLSQYCKLASILANFFIFIHHDICCGTLPVTSCSAILNLWERNAFNLTTYLLQLESICSTCPVTFFLNFKILSNSSSTWKAKENNKKIVFRISIFFCIKQTCKCQ